MASQSSRDDDFIVPAEKLLHDIFDALEQRPIGNVKTGLKEMDCILGGLGRGELIVIGARPGHGKTSLATAIAAYTSIDNAIETIFFNLESDGQQFCRRMLSSLSQIEHHRLKMGKLNSAEYTRLAEKVGALAKAPLYVASLSTIPIDLLCSVARTAVREKNVKVVLIDYLQRISAPGDSRTEQLTAISGSLKSLALELKVPVICFKSVEPGNVRAKRSATADEGSSGIGDAGGRCRLGSPLEYTGLGQ